VALGGPGAELDRVPGQVHVGLFQRGAVGRHLGEGHAGLGQQRHDPLGGQAGDGQGVPPGRRDGGAGVRQHCRRLGPSTGPQQDRVAGGGRDQLGHGRVGDYLAAARHHEVIGGVLQFAHQVAGHQNRPALGRQRLQEPAHPHDALGVHAVEGLIEHQHRRVAEHRRGDAEPLAHAQRVPARLAPRHRREAGLLEYLVGPPRTQALGVSEPHQVVAGGAARLERGRVQQRADVAERPAQPGIRLAPDQRLARVGRVQAQDHPHRGGLAGAVGTDETSDLARLHGEGHAVQGQRGTESLAQPGQFYRRFHASNARVWRPVRRHAAERCSATLT
jgi:hypothetical protein